MSSYVNILFGIIGNVFNDHLVKVGDHEGMAMTLQSEPRDCCMNYKMTASECSCDLPLGFDD